MKLFLNSIKTRKTLYILKKYRLYTFILNKKNINKVKLKEYFFRNYLLKVKKINIIKIKKKIKIIVKFNINKKNKKFLLNYEEIKKNKI
ncbi:MAG: hypothetical protein NHF85_00195 [Candidatus Shikimatogenerans sp. JK-2022]|nr:hypothetical protein [Candidatus Shikimatogenerans bostrichidophilus]